MPLIPIEIRHFGLDEIPPMLPRLERLYRKAFHNSHMYEGLLEDLSEAPKVFRLFFAVPTGEPDEVVGARIIESKLHPDFEYLGHPPVHGKRFCILPSARGCRIGERIVAAGKQYCFDEIALDALFGESNEIGALAMHGREGALFSLTSIHQISNRNSPEENLSFFRKFLSDPNFRRYRYPVGPGIRFVYCRDLRTIKQFVGEGFVSRAQLQDIEVY